MAPSTARQLGSEGGGGEGAVYQGGRADSAARSRSNAAVPKQPAQPRFGFSSGMEAAGDGCPGARGTGREAPGGGVEVAQLTPCRVSNDCACVDGAIRPARRRNEAPLDAASWGSAHSRLCTPCRFARQDCHTPITAR